MTNPQMTNPQMTNPQIKRIILNITYCIKRI